MDDPLLLARLDALQQNLNDVAPIRDGVVVWPTLLGLERVTVDTEVWSSLASGVSKQIQMQKIAIGRVRKALQEAKDAEGLAGAWRAYSLIFEQSQDIFSECLELLGGLTFREKVEPGPERNVYRLADALIRTYTRRIERAKKSLAVPASREAMRRTLGGVIRLRYPEWSIWSLPITAYEYGRVVEDQPEALLKSVREYDERWRDPTGAGPDGETAEEIETRTLRHLQTHWADAFATYTLGPAYAWTMVYLRFNPAIARSDSEGPCDEARLQLILGILRKMDEETPARPYSKIISDVEDKWRVIAERAQPAYVLDEAARSKLATLTDALWDRLEMDFPLTGYKVSDWQTAQQWALVWMRDLQAGGGERLQNQQLVVPLSSSMRDVLNAAWWSRMNQPAGRPDRSVDIADAARALCDVFLERENPSPAPEAKANRAAPAQSFTSDKVEYGT